MKTLKYISILTAVVAFNQVISLTPNIPQMVYYGILGIFLLLGILSSKNININPIIIWLIFAAITSLVVNDIPAYFQAPLRLVTFVLILSLIGPFLRSESLNNIRQNIFNKLNLLIIIGTSLSFFIYILKLPVPQFGGFSGLFNHSMMLGPLAGISMILLIYHILNNQSHWLTKQKRIFIYSLLLFSFIAILIASSRSAIAGTAIGILLFLFKLYRNRFSRLISIFFSLTILLILTFPVWSDYTAGIQQKQKYSTEAGDMAATRRSYWEARIEEFKKSPVFGIGFSTLDVSKSGIGVQKKSGGIEPGTSWLAILSMVGIFGFIPVFLLFLRNINYLLRDREKPIENALLIGLLVFFATHMFAEGYFFASGGFLFFYLWLLLGVIEVNIYNSTYKIEILGKPLNL